MRARFVRLTRFGGCSRAHHRAAMLRADLDRVALSFQLKLAVAFRVLAHVTSDVRRESAGAEAAGIGGYSPSERAAAVSVASCLTRKRFNSRGRAWRESRDYFACRSRRAREEGLKALATRDALAVINYSTEFYGVFRLTDALGLSGLRKEMLMRRCFG